MDTAIETIKLSSFLSLVILWYSIMPVNDADSLKIYEKKTYCESFYLL